MQSQGSSRHSAAISVSNVANVSKIIFISWQTQKPNINANLGKDENTRILKAEKLTYLHAENWTVHSQ